MSKLTTFQESRLPATREYVRKQFANMKQEPESDEQVELIARKIASAMPAFGIDDMA